MSAMFCQSAIFLITKFFCCFYKKNVFEIIKKQTAEVQHFLNRIIKKYFGNILHKTFCK